MDALQRQRIKKLRQQGQTYKSIAVLLGVSMNTVKSYCQRNDLGGTQPSDGVGEQGCCRNCGVEIFQVLGRKRRRFCSPECRTAWWTENPARTEAATYVFTCQNCGERFEAYGNKGRKYCCHDCYVTHRFQVAA